MDDNNTPVNWPRNIRHLTQPQHSLNLTAEQTRQLTSRTQHDSRPHLLPTVRLPLSSPTHIAIRQINDPSHPAHTQYGLFATQSLPPSSLILPYLGYVHSNDLQDTDTSSDYDLSLDRDINISVDASKSGNEARMINDYRGVPRPAHQLARLKKGEKLGPNAEFRDLWFEYEDGSGERGIGIFVLAPGKSGRWKDGIVAGDEILVNYGKVFWKERSETSRT